MQRFLSTVFLLALSMALVQLTYDEARATQADKTKSEHRTGIKITDASYYAAWGMSTIHSVNIENTSDKTYKNIRVKIGYRLSYYPKEQSTAIVTLPVTIPPKSKGTYLKRGCRVL